jgi:HlyD family secretion protein
VTLDAFTDQTFTGKVLSIDKVGTSSSGVTAYPVVIGLDLDNKKILPNMSASASILTDRESNVLFVPSGAVSESDSGSTVKVLKDKQVSIRTVTTGMSNETQIEIKSGLKEGELVVTGSSSLSSNVSNTSSPFGISTRGMGGGMGSRPQ